MRSPSAGAPDSTESVERLDSIAHEGFDDGGGRSDLAQPAAALPGGVVQEIVPPGGERRRPHLAPQDPLERHRQRTEPGSLPAIDERVPDVARRLAGVGARDDELLAARRGDL